MLKFLGAVLILAAGGSFCWHHIRCQRQQVLAIQELIGALQQMETEIRWRNTSLPEAIGLQSERPYIGSAFAEILQGMKGEFPFQKVWESAFEALQPKQAAEIICRISLSGDAQQIMQSLHGCAAQLQEVCCQLQQSRKDGEKLYLAATFSGTGLLVILLI